MAQSICESNPIERAAAKQQWEENRGSFFAWRSAIKTGGESCDDVEIGFLSRKAALLPADGDDGVEESKMKNKEVKSVRSLEKRH